MKKLLTAFLFMAIASTGFCTKPCNGLCGFKLGEKIDENKALVIETSPSGIKTYFAKDFTKFMEVNIVMIRTLQDNSIFSIYALSEIPQNKADNYYKQILTVIDKHYEIDPKIKKSFEEPLDLSTVYDFPENIQMFVNCSRQGYSVPAKVSINVLNTKIQEKVNKEDEEAKIKSIDTSALE